MLGGDWPAPAVVLAGPAGCGKTSFITGVADALQLRGVPCAAVEAAVGLDAPAGGVALVDDRSPADAARAVIDLVRAGWRVLVAVAGPSVAVEEAFAALGRAGRVALVEVPALDRAARTAIVAGALAGAGPAAVDVLARGGPTDGSSLAVLAARAEARAALAGTPLDAVAVATLRRVTGGDVPPVPVGIDRLVTSAAVVPEEMLAMVADGVRPLDALGPLGKALADGAAVVAGGSDVAARVAMHHAFAGRSVLVVSARRRDIEVASALVRIAGGELWGSDGIPAAVVMSLPIAVLADGAASLRDVPGIVRRCRPHVGFTPDVVVAELHAADDLDALAGTDAMAVVTTDAGVAEASWDVDEVAVRRRGEPWARLAAPALPARGSTVPLDDTGAVRAWRLWQLVIDADGVALGSPVRSTVWPRGVLTSTCLRCGSKPAPGCSCGIYAFTSPATALATWRRNPQLVFGELRCWGRIARHSDGIRAEHAQPVKLYLGTIGADTERRSIAARYGCDVVGR